MAHPDLLRAGETGEHRVGRSSSSQRGQAVLALVALRTLAAQQVRHELLAVADAEHRLPVLQRWPGSTVGLSGS